MANKGKTMFQAGQLLQVNRGIQIRVSGGQLVEGYVLKDDKGVEYMATIDPMPTQQNKIHTSPYGNLGKK
jgi:hypothetical protein